MAIDINDTRGLHAAELVRDALRNMNKPVATAKILILGASYREDIGDTRYSGSEILVRKLKEMGADIRVHDPYVKNWWEFLNQDIPPSSLHSKKQFFRNQDELSELELENDIVQALKDIDCFVLAVRHKDYLNLEPQIVIDNIGKPVAVVDCFGILKDDKIRRYFELGCEVKGMGRGHIQRIKDAVRKGN